jgi:hypothetical protein
MREEESACDTHCRSEARCSISYFIVSMGNGKERRGKLDQTIIGPVTLTLGLPNTFAVRRILKIGEDGRNLHIDRV